MTQSWRWYGPKDSVSLADVRMAGATDVVTALHHIPNGEIWPIEEIRKRQQEVSKEGLTWSVVESVPVHEDIKQRAGNFEKYIRNYQETLKNLATCGIHIVCYNFMPVVDWTRTSLNLPMPDGSLALAYDKHALAAFDLHILKREGAREEYSNDEIAAAENYFNQQTEEEKQVLVANLLKGLPGAEESFTLEQFRDHLNNYRHISDEVLRKNLYAFLEAIIPVAESVGVKMCIHPDDPPFPLFGLPRVVSTEKDFKQLLDAVPSYYNGVTFCSGSLGSRGDHNLTDLFKTVADRVHFIHLRNVQRTLTGFHESDHLDGSVDMVALVDAILDELLRRQEKNHPDVHVPFRPDHGHQMLDDLHKVTNPGYSAIGRLRGMAEIRGLELGLLKTKLNV